MSCTEPAYSEGGGVKERCRVLDFRWSGVVSRICIAKKKCRIPALPNEGVTSCGRV